MIVINARFLTQETRGVQRFAEHTGPEPEIQEPGPGDFHRLAPRGDIEAGDDIGGQLAGVEFARLGQGHDRGALVIAEFRIRTRADEDGGHIRVRQHRTGGLLQAEFNLFMRQHREDLSTKEHEGARIKTGRGSGRRTTSSPAL